MVGTAEDETILFGPGPGAGNVQLKRNGIQLGTFHPADRLTAHGLDGDDTIQVAGSIDVSAWLYGDAGDDVLNGGAGHDVVLGGAGDDLLIGQSGRDVMIGGVGADRILGNAGEDILIAGYVELADGAALEPVLDAVMNRWTSEDDWEVRYDDVKSDFLVTDGENATVFDDDAKDVITGSAGTDWCFAQLDGDNGTAIDKITDWRADKHAPDDLDFLLLDAP